MKKFTLLVCTLFSIISYAQTFTVDNLNYQVIEGTTNVTITGGDVSGNLTIPEEVSAPNDTTQKYTVTQIGTDAFRSKGLTSVIFPNSITFIGFNSFRNNRNLVNPTLPSNLERLDRGAFRDGKKITAITFPESLVSIGQECFKGASALRTITLLGTTPPTVNPNSFDLEQLADLTIPDGTLQAYIDKGWKGYKTTNGEVGLGNQFENNNLFYIITSVEPNTVEVKGGNISTANGNKNLTIPETVTLPETTNLFTITSVGEQAFRNKALTGLTLPNTLTTLAFRAFRDNTTLTEVTIPESVIEIASEAFFNNRLTKLTILNPTPLNSINNGTFGNRSVTDLFVPNDALTTYQANSKWQGFKSVSKISEDTLSSDILANNNTLSFITNNNTITVKAPDNTLKQYTIYNIIGSTVASNKLANINNIINISHLMHGVYILAVETEAGIFSKKFTKQ